MKLIALILMIMTASASGETLHVLGISGDAVRLSQDKSAYQKRLNDAVKSKRLVASALPSLVFPLTSKLVPQANVAQHQPNGYVGWPLCVIGSDAASERWIKNQSRALHSKGVVCLLVAAQSQATLTRLRTMAGQLPIVALNADEPLLRAGVTGYPALIYPRGFSQ